MSTFHRENIVLFNVLNQEVIFEEYFCNLLRIDDFRQIFIDFINEKNNILDGENIEYTHFNTEVILDNQHGRADLFLNIDDNKKFIFEIKNKDYTSLTPNQPQSYLNYLRNTHKDGVNFNKHLFFLIPKNYQHKDKLHKQWKEFDDKENQIFYWQDLIYKVKANKLEKQYVEIQMFCEFCEYWFNIKPINFSEDEKKLFNPKGQKVSDFKNLSVPILIQKLESVVRNIGSNAGMKEGKSSSGFFYSMKIRDYEIWFGIDYDIWEDKGTPLSILIQNHKNGYGNFELELSGIELEKFAYNETSASEQYFGYIVNVDDEVGSDSYQKTVVDIIHQIKNQLK